MFLLLLPKTAPPGDFTWGAIANITGGFSLNALLSSKYMRNTITMVAI